MSLYLIKKFQEQLEKIIQYGGSYNEGAISSAFQNLLNEYCKTKNLMLISQIDVKTKDGNTVRPDGTVKDSLRLEWGYWESKDGKDDLDVEIQKKFAKGYPQTNILFEDSKTAVLIQNGLECKRASMKDADALNELLSHFVSYERPEVHDFREAIEHFKQDIPSIIEALREIIEEESSTNQKFQKARDTFLELCMKSINPHITIDDIREMMIQHILTEEIFLEVFSETQFHRENNIARELQKVVDTFFTGKTKKETLSKIENYYKVIRRTATDIADHHEKQKFLKVLYENFYKVYNPKAADRLGVVYTPNEIVRFMIESTDYLLHKNFNKFLGDSNVEIMDPFTGTGTYITEMIDYLPKDKLKYKYQSEIHCNEVAILPYYVANLNIEYTYYQKMQQYEEFKNMCFVDTLDNLGFEFSSTDQQMDAFGFASENTERIKRQNERKISVIISNPPYNANQLNENENNKNREYDEIDKNIKETWIKASGAQKTKLYDMYTRALKWATLRLNKNGIVSFVSNNSFIDSKTYDGFRKEIVKEFNEIYIIDLKGNARTSGERRRRESGNVFDDQIRVGVAIYFLIRIEGKVGCDIYYNAIDDYVKSEEKRNYLSENRITEIEFTHITPDKNGNWINLTDNDFETLLPLANKQTKLTKKKSEENALFKIFSTGISTNRDDWVLDYSVKSLEDKMKYFIKVFDEHLNTKKDLGTEIKWSRNLKQRLSRKLKESFDKGRIQKFNYRPYSKNHFYKSDLFIDEHGMDNLIFPKINICICFSGKSSSKPFYTLPSNRSFSLDFIEKTQGLPLYRYDESCSRIENITEWGLEQFRNRYCPSPTPSPREGAYKTSLLKTEGISKSKTSPSGRFGGAITKQDIFHYVYAVLHNPAYRKKYEQNLKREFPRIPFYEDFWWWAKRGEQLMELHLNYETTTPSKLKQIENVKSHSERSEESPKKSKKEILLRSAHQNDKTQKQPKPILKADKEAGIIYIDENTHLEGIPKEAWLYKLGNRSALEWVLDQYKEKKIKDPTVRAKFNTYKFADYKEEVIELIKKVCKVSVETVKIIDEMENQKL